MKTRNIGLGAVGGLLTIAIVGLLTDRGYSESRPPAAVFDARVEARQFVKNLLTSPGSAEFSNESAVQGEDGAWLVEGQVAALNSYGAVTRSAYLCRFRKFDATHWELAEPCEVMGL